MNELGIDNFYVELLESQIENYNEMEIYYIKKLNTLRPNGYNLAKGGAWYPNLSGTEHHNATITSPEDLNAIIDELKNTNYSLTEIGEHFGVRYGVIADINQGHTYRQDNVDYPIREFTLSEEKLERLIYDLKYSNYNYEQLGEMYGISTAQIKAINYGYSWHKDYLTYPVRQMVFSGDDDTYEKIQKDLLSTSIDYHSLAKRYDCSYNTILRINKGETAYNDKLKYPLRKIGKLSTEDVQVVHQLLLESDLSINEIAAMFDVSDPTIKRINSGSTKKYIDERFTYPLRK